MAREYKRTKAGLLKHSKNHIRQTLGTEDELRPLGRSYLTRPLNPLICRLDLEVIEGNRRLAGVLLEGGPDVEIPVCITDEVIDESAKIEIFMESSVHTRALIPYEEYVGAEKWMELNPGATTEQLATRIGRSPSMMTRIRSLGRCIRPVQEAAAAGGLGISEWYEFSKCDERQQHELWAARASRQLMGRDQLARAGRRNRQSNGTSADKVARVKCLLHGGEASVVVSNGGQLGMEEMIDYLVELVREAKKAREDGLSVRSFERVLKDKAKKGGGA